MRWTYKGLTQSLPIGAAGPDGKKRPIHLFPKVGALKDPGLGAFKVYFPHFLGKRRGSDPLTPELGTSLHALLETQDEEQRAAIVRRVAREEIPETFGRYLEVIRSFDVTVHPEARTMEVSLARLIEQAFGYRPFPMELADVPLPELRVESLHESATLLGAFFADRGTLANLP